MTCLSDTVFKCSVEK